MILRGCFTAYAVLALVFGVLAVLDGPIGPEVILIVFAVGLVAALPFAVFAVVLWGVLVALGVHLRWWHCLAVGALVFGLSGFALAFMEGERAVIWMAIAAGPLLGAIAGGLFWIGAFGRARSVQMGQTTRQAV